MKNIKTFHIQISETVEIELSFYKQIKGEIRLKDENQLYR
jgi:hypothetical protein